MNTVDIQALFRDIDASLQANASTAGSATTHAGWIRSVQDGILHVSGLTQVAMGEVIQVTEVEGVEALVMQLDQDDVFAVLLTPQKGVRAGHMVVPTGRTLSIEVSDTLLGRVVNPIGQSIDGRPISHTKTAKFMPLEARAPGVIDRQPVSEPVQTGILAIDAMIPIGRGQRELIIGDRQTGKTSVAIDAIINQKGGDMICVYVAIGQRESTTATVVERLRAAGALEYTVVVAAGASSPAPLQFLAPYAGAAVGEYFMHQGKHVLVVYDDLTKHAVSYRELSLLLRRPPGREAYPGDVFYLHSRLLERAAKLSDELGAGSLTALPIIETQAGDVSAYIPTNVISITDGQIFLESQLFNAGVRPAVNIGISVSRVGGAAQTGIIKKLSGSAKLDLAQYYELAAFTQFASELDDTTKRQLTRGERVVEVMKQGVTQPFALWEEAVLLFAVSKGFFDGVARSEVVALKKTVLEEIRFGFPELVERVETEKKLSDEIKKDLETIVPKVFDRLVVRV